MGMVFKQVYSGVPSGIADACMPSGSQQPTDPFDGVQWFAAVGASTSNSNKTVTLDGGVSGGRNQATVQCLAQWHGIPSDYGSAGETTTWEAGDWICRFSVQSANSAIYWDSVQICALVGATYTTIATKTGINTFLSGTGTYATTITTTSPSTVTLGSAVWWGFHFGKGVTLNAETFNIRSNKNLATPIENKRAVTTVSLASSPVLPGTTFGGINAPVPATTFASGLLVPTTTFGNADIAAPSASVASAPIAPGTTFGGTNVAVPAASISSGAVVPGVTFGGISANVPTVSIASAGIAPTTPGLITPVDLISTPRGVISSSAPEAAIAFKTANAERAVLCAAASEVDAAGSGKSVRSSAVSSAFKTSSAATAAAQQAQLSIAALEKGDAVSGTGERSAAVQGGIEGASFEKAMISNGAFASGGPEVFCAS